MYRVLLIEQSPTHRHILSQDLTRPGILVEKCTTFQEGLDLLITQGEQFDGVVLGWPIYLDVQIKKIQSKLCHSSLQEIAVIALTEDIHHPNLEWVTQKSFGIIMPWKSHRLIGQKLDNLFLDISIDSTENKIRHKMGDEVRILLVDDSRTIRVMYRRILQRQGYRVDIASSVNEGFELAKSKHFDIAIIDYFMKGGNGDTLCRKLSAHPKTEQITTSILTGTYSDEVIETSLRAGAIECMFKNESEALFIARVDAMSHSVLSRRAIHREHLYLESILGSVGEGVYGVNRNLHISFVNPAAQVTLGYHKDEMIGRKPNKLFHYALTGGDNNPPNKCFLNKAYSTGAKVERWQTVFWNKNNQEIPVECTVHPLNVKGTRQGAVVAFRDISERKSMEDELRWQANHDTLTKLFNRRHFEYQLETELQRLKRSEESSALLYIDLDRFKYINDSAGHIAGDKLLVEVSQQLQQRLRAPDILARIGGDEFAVILRNIDTNTITTAANAFRSILEDYNFIFNGKNYRIHCSIGVSLLDKNCVSTVDALSTADVALHIAKEKGRNNVHIYSADNDARKMMDKDLSWSVQLKNAIDQDLFKLVFQPMIPVKALLSINDQDSEAQRWQKIWQSVEGEPLCCETLLRLPGPHQQDIRPGVFLGTAERFNFMPSIDRWVIAQAIKKLAEFNTNSDRLQLTINLSGDTISDDSLGDFIQHKIKYFDVNPKNLIFEITETSAINNIKHAQSLIKDLRQFGCRFALDDFGSGFCSFGQLKNLNVDLIKIDGQFSLGLVNDPIDREIMIAIAQIAKTLGATTVAEFVESRDIVSYLQDCGIDYAQGYYISEPVVDIPLL